MGAGLPCPEQKRPLTTSNNIQKGKMLFLHVLCVVPLSLGLVQKIANFIQCFVPSRNFKTPKQQF
jgi:hypothetical protein